MLALLDSLARIGTFSQLGGSFLCALGIFPQVLPLFGQDFGHLPQLLRRRHTAANKTRQFVRERPGKLGVLSTRACLRLTMWSCAGLSSDLQTAGRMLKPRSPHNSRQRSHHFE